jgi:hypothetical protein
MNTTIGFAMIYSYTLNNRHIQTGDILCTTSEGSDIEPGQFWRLLGRLVPGEIDHVAIYLGPGGLCIESAILGVNAFTISGEVWSAGEMVDQRGHFIDKLYGVAFPLKNVDFDTANCEMIRAEVRSYCLSQLGKPYNINFFNPETEESFYCSQLAYKAYLKFGINLNTGLGVPNLPGSSRIIFPQEIWNGCDHSTVD